MCGLSECMPRSCVFQTATKVHVNLVVSERGREGESGALVCALPTLERVCCWNLDIIASSLDTLNS
jgi:hypothetical protein